jgi:hypothetical protein
MSAAKHFILAAAACACLVAGAVSTVQAEKAGGKASQPTSRAQSGPIVRDHSGGPGPGGANPSSGGSWNSGNGIVRDHRTNPPRTGGKGGGGGSKGGKGGK